MRKCQLKAELLIHCLHPPVCLTANDGSQCYAHELSMARWGLG